MAMIIGVDELTRHGATTSPSENYRHLEAVHRRGRALYHASPSSPACRWRWSAAGRSASRRRSSDAWNDPQRDPGASSARPTSRFLVEAMGITLALTFFGCVLGFLFAFFIVFARQTPGHWALPLRAARDPLCRDLPAHPVPGDDLSGAVLHPGGHRQERVAVRHRADRHLHLCDRLHRRHHSRRLRIGAAPADRGGAGDELRPLADPDPRRSSRNPGR